jgi:hypothetical protein
LKSNVAPPHLPNIYNRNQNTPYFQPPSIAAASAMPLYSTTVTNSPIAMMNYFNAPTNTIRHHNHHQQHQPTENFGHEQFLLQHIPVDVVSSCTFNNLVFS